MFKNTLFSRVSIMAFVGFCALSSSPVWANDEDECEIPPTTTSICHLSDEARLEILSHLSPKELATVTQLSSKWHGLADDESLWKKYSHILDLEAPEGTPSKSIVRVALETETINMILNGIRNSDLIEGPDLIEEYAKLGHELVQEKQIQGYALGIFGYTKDENKASQLRAQLLVENKIEEKTQEWEEILERQIDRLREGSRGYSQNIEEADRLEAALNSARSSWKKEAEDNRDLNLSSEKSKIEGLAKDEFKAIQHVIKGKLTGEYGYEKDADFPKNHIEFLKSVKSRPTAE